MSHNSLIFRYLGNFFRIFPTPAAGIDSPESGLPPLAFAALRFLGTGAILLLSASCAGMSQQNSGLAGGLAGAAIGATAGGAAVKNNGGNRGQSMAGALVGGLGGYGVGTQVGRGFGLPGVDHTEVPNQ